MRRKSISSSNHLRFEQLESRALLSGVPFGAVPNDTAEFLLGRIAVTPVLLESDGSLDPSTQNWDAAERQQALQKVQESVDWWSDTLAGITDVHTLDFVIDETFIDNPQPTRYEPIDRVSSAYNLWAGEFLLSQGINGGFSLEQGIRDFNHAQRLKHDTDWSFTIFIVDSSDDPDGQFAAGGPFQTAFAFAGGLFYITPSTRPASTFAHEMGHIFYALDEYPGGSSYDVERGYYSTQNVNASNNPNAESQPSIMSGGLFLQTAYLNNTSPASTLALVGWQDSDGDGIFDVLDVPLELTGSGRFDSSTGTYRFEGYATAKALANQNPVGLQNDITLNEVSFVEYRLDDGPWHIAAQPNLSETSLSLQIPVSQTFTNIEIRARDADTGVTSNIITGNASDALGHEESGASGFVWLDRTNNQILDAQDPGLSGIDIQVLDSTGQALDLTKTVDPDNFDAGIIDASALGVTLSTIGNPSLESSVYAVGSNFASTGNNAFFAKSLSTGRFIESWSSTNEQRLRAEFDQPTNRASIDATGLTNQSYVRIEAFDASGNLISRTTSDPINTGETATIEIEESGSTIKSIVVYGHSNTSVSLDNLQFGPNDSTETDALGVFALPGLPDGDYQILASSPNFDFPVSTFNTEISGGVAASLSIPAVSDVSPWQNPTDIYDVNGSGSSEPLDALIIINELNRGGSRVLGQGDVQSPFYDVNGSGSISPVDALAVLNFLNRTSAQGEFGSATPQIVVHENEEPEVVNAVDEAFRQYLPSAEPAQNTTFTVDAQTIRPPDFVESADSDKTENLDYLRQVSAEFLL